MMIIAFTKMTLSISPSCDLNFVCKKNQVQIEFLSDSYTSKKLK